MLIYIHPMYSKAELNADSNYVIYSQLCRAILDKTREAFFVIAFPDAASGFKYEEDGFFRDPNILRVPIRISPRKQANAVTYDGAWGDWLLRQFGFDALWVNLVEAAGHLRVAGDSTMEDAGRPAVIAAHNYVIHRSLPYPMEPQENVLMAQLLGAVCADVNVFNSQHCRKMLMENAESYLSPAMAERIRASGQLIPYGPLDPREFGRLSAMNEIPVIAYNHRLQAYKNFRQTFAILEELWREGLRFRVRYLNNVAEKASQIARYPFVDIKLCATRKDYLAALSGCDLNVTNSQHETFCISAIESMAFGQPLIAPNGVTFPEITGQRETGHPWLFENAEEQKAMLRTALRDMAERRKRGAILREFVLREFSHGLWAERYLGLFLRETQKRAAAIGTDAEILGWVEQTLAQKRQWKLQDAKRALRGKTIGGRTPFSNQSLTLSKLVRMARGMGWRTALQGQEQILIRGAA